MTHVQVQWSCRVWRTSSGPGWVWSVCRGLKTWVKRRLLACLEQPPIPRGDTTQSAQWLCALLLIKLWNTIGCYCDLKLWVTPGFFERLEHEKVTWHGANKNTEVIVWKTRADSEGLADEGWRAVFVAARLGHCSGLMSDSCFTEYILIVKC